MPDRYVPVLDGGMKVPTGKLASGTADSTTFLRGDQTWQRLYPVGAVYLSMTNTNPSTVFGGTWALIGSTKLFGGSTPTIFGFQRTA